MSKITEALYNIRHLEELSRKKTGIHDIHPLAKLLVTFAYIVIVVSFDKYELEGLLSFLFYPVIIIAAADIPVRPLLKRILLIEPLIIGIGILNPFLDQSSINIAGMIMSRGWVTFLAIAIKCSLTALAALLLISTTGMDKIAAALRILKIPRLLVIQLLLMYRYISVLMEEVARIIQAYSFRALKQKGIHRKAWGSLVGQLMLRTVSRSERIYQAMCLRGFNGEYNTGSKKFLSMRDMAYIAVWTAYFILARLINLSELIGEFFTGLMV